MYDQYGWSGKNCSESRRKASNAIGTVPGSLLSARVGVEPWIGSTRRGRCAAGSTGPIMNVGSESKNIARARSESRADRRPRGRFP